MPRLLRLMAAKEALIPFFPRRTRRSSPRGGRSTLTTSAPRSARKAAQYGPAMTRERSRTRMPSSRLMTGSPCSLSLRYGCTRCRISKGSRPCRRPSLARSRLRPPELRAGAVVLDGQLPRLDHETAGRHRGDDLGGTLRLPEHEVGARARMETIVGQAEEPRGIRGEHGEDIGDVALGAHVAGGSDKITHEGEIARA